MFEYIDESLDRLYSQGKNDYEVAHELHIGRTRLRAWREAHGIPSQTTKKGLSVELCPDILSMLSSGQDLTEIGKKYGVNRTSIAKLLKKHGFKYKVRSRPRPIGILEYSFTDIQKQVLLGEMFGDGGIARVSDTSAYYYCMHSISQRDFVLWKRDVFLPLSARMVYRTDHHEDGRDLLYVGTQTWSSKCMHEYYTRFYDKEISSEKILTPEMVSELTDLALAVWYMGDGSINRNTGVFHVGLHIDLEPIATALSNKFSMWFKACRYEKEWHLRVMEPARFFSLIEPHLLNIFKYKIPSRFL